MALPTIIYHGAPGLQAQTLTAYFIKLGYSVLTAHSTSEIRALADSEWQPVVVLDLKAPSSTLIHLSREIIQDPSGAFPHLFILYDGKPFDTQLEAVTLIAGRDKLKRLVNYITAIG